MAKAGKVRTRKRGKTWSYIFEAGQVNGKRKVVEKGGFATEKEAYTAGVEKYNDFLHGNIGITSESITLKDFMTNWLNEVVALNVKTTTLQSYKTLLRYQIAPLIGDLKVQDITPTVLDKWIRDLQRTGLSFNTLSRAHTLLHQALSYAVYPAQLINTNPINYIKVPKSAPKNIVKRTIITPEQIKALLEKYPFGKSYHIPILLMYHTGMRIGEVVGLSWSDVNFETKELTVRRQIVYVRKRGYFLTTLKTESSKRYVIVDDYLLGELKRWRSFLAEQEEKLGATYVYTYVGRDGFLIRQSKSLPVSRAEKISLICVQANGKIVIKDNLQSALARDGLNSHSFRHTHATQLIESGAKPKGVAGRLGHANAIITQNLYTHNTRLLQEETADFFAKNLQTNG